jgi:hypothetical protein
MQFVEGEADKAKGTRREQPCSSYGWMPCFYEGGILRGGMLVLGIYTK